MIEIHTLPTVTVYLQYFVHKCDKSVTYILRGFKCSFIHRLKFCFVDVFIEPVELIFLLIMTYMYVGY